MALPTSIREWHLPKPGIQSLTIQHAPLPTYKSTQVLVKIHAVSLQYRDLMVASGQYPPPIHPNLIPCSDCAGEVVAVGDDVKGWSKGDRVCANFALDHLDGDTNTDIQKTALGGAIDGVLAEYKVFPAHSLVRVPDHLSYEEGSTLPCAALTAYNALIGPKPLKGGDWVLVQGTGGVSIFALQLAAASGATVITTSSSDAKLKIAAQLGAKHLINYTTTPNWDAEVLRITGGRGVDHIVEVGGPGTIGRSAKAVRVAGYIHAIGFVSQDRDEVNIIANAIRRGFILRGIQIGSVAQFRDMNRLIAAHAVRPAVDRVFAFEEAVAAYEYLQSQAHVGKVVIKVSKD